jgi:hypothetical protein
MVLDDPAHFSVEKSRGSDYIFKHAGSVSGHSGGSRNQSAQTVDLEDLVMMIPEPETLRHFNSARSISVNDDDVFARLPKSVGGANESLTDKSIAEYFHRSDVTSSASKAGYGSKFSSIPNPPVGHLEPQSKSFVKNLSRDSSVFQSSSNNCWTYSGRCDVEILSDPDSRMSLDGGAGCNRMGIFPTLPNRTKPKLNAIEKPVRKCESFHIVNKQQQQQQQKQQTVSGVSKEVCNYVEKKSPENKLVRDENQNVVTVQQCGEVKQTVVGGSIRRQKNHREMMLKRSKSRARMLKTEEQVKIVKFRRFLAAANIDGGEFKRRILAAKHVDQRKNEKER